MKAIFVGGPLHGHQIDIHTATCIKVFNREQEADVYIYTRRPNSPAVQPALAVFAPTELSPEQLDTALQLAVAPEAARLGDALGPYSYLKIDDDL
jgi:hypothetical protein